MNLPRSAPHQAVAAVRPNPGAQPLLCAASWDGVPHTVSYMAVELLLLCAPLLGLDHSFVPPLPGQPSLLCDLPPWVLGHALTSVAGPGCHCWVPPSGSQVMALAHHHWVLMLLLWALFPESQYVALVGQPWGHATDSCDCSWGLSWDFDTPPVVCATIAPALGA